MKRMINKKHFYFTKDYSEIFVSEELHDVLNHYCETRRRDILGFCVYVHNNLQIIIKDNILFLPGSNSRDTKMGFTKSEIFEINLFKYKHKIFPIIKAYLQELKEEYEKNNQ